MTRNLRGWVMTDGKPGMENQCLGLAEAVAMETVVKRIAPRFPWTVLPPQLWLRPLAAPGGDGDAVAPPWPDILIATGRQTVALSIAVKRASGGRTYTVQIQNPTVAPAKFDLVVVPRHDHLSGPNVVVTDGALHRVTAARLAAEADRFRAGLADLPRPLVAVLIGGSNRQYRMTAAVTEALAEALLRLVRVHGAGLAVTPSRRTGSENEALLRGKLAGAPAVIWDGTGDNPYFGYLGLADAIVVTSDSVSMASEACSTGKPVYVFDLEGGSRKFREFHSHLRAVGVTRAFAGDLETWDCAPLDDTARVAGIIRRTLRAGAPGQLKSADSGIK